MEDKSFSLSIKDFQIIKNLNITFYPGLNAIVGNSNNGKSSLYRSLSSCIYNDSTPTYIRNGCSSYAVGIKYNGHTIVCQKGKENTYKVDGLLYQKVGRTQIPEVANSLNIKELNLNGINEHLNFWYQMDKPFLLDRSETDLFRFIVDTGKDSNISSALKNLVSDRQKITKDISICEGMLEQALVNKNNISDKLTNGKEIKEVCNNIIKIGPYISKVQDIDRLLIEYNKKNEEMLRAVEYNKKNDEIINYLLKETDKTNNMVNLLDILRDNISMYKAYEINIDKLNEEMAKIDSINAPSLSKALEEYNTIRNELKCLRDIENDEMEYNKIKIPEYDEDIKSKVDLYEKLNNELKCKEDIEKYIDSIKNQYNKIIEEMKVAEEEINKIGVCPVCKQPINKCMEV